MIHRGGLDANNDKTKFQKRSHSSGEKQPQKNLQGPAPLLCASSPYELTPLCIFRLVHTGAIIETSNSKVTILNYLLVNSNLPLTRARNSMCFMALVFHSHVDQADFFGENFDEASQVPTGCRKTRRLTAVCLGAGLLVPKTFQNQLGFRTYP
jgi:hypothetical protein